MNNKAMKLTDDAESKLSALLSEGFSDAYDHRYGEVGFRAVEGYDYYYGRLPKPTTKGGSKTVDRVVGEAVDSTLAELMTIFCKDKVSGIDVITPTPTYLPNGKSLSEAINDVLFSQNKGRTILGSTMKESLITRAGFTKTYIKHCVEKEEFNFEGIDQETLDLYVTSISDSGNSIKVSQEVDEETGLLVGTITYDSEYDKVVVENVPMEEMFINSDAVDIDSARYVCQRTKVTKDEVMKLFDLSEEEVMELGRGTGEDWLAVDTSRSPTYDFTPQTTLHDSSDQLVSELWLDENYIRTSAPDEKKGVRLYQVFSVSNSIISVEEVNEHPFSLCTPSPVVGGLFGESLYDKLREIQNAKTALRRGLIDNVMSANYGRYQAVKGQYDVRSLLDNRPGGVVEMEALGMVNMFPHRPLPQGIDFAIQQMDTAKDRVTGLSDMSQGLDASALDGNPASAASIQLVQASAQSKVRAMAINIEDLFITPLIRKIYSLLMEIYSASGQWPKSEEVTVDACLSSQEKASSLQALQVVHERLSNDPALAPTYLAEQRKQLLNEQIKLQGGYRIDASDYMIPFDQLSTPQPDPMQVAQMQLVQAQANNLNAIGQAEVLSAQVKAQDNQLKQVVAADDMDLKQAESMANAMKAQADQMIAQSKLMMAQVEMANAQQELEASAYHKGVEGAAKATQQQFDNQMKLQELSLEQNKLILESQKVRNDELRTQADIDLTEDTGESVTID